MAKKLFAAAALFLIMVTCAYAVTPHGTETTATPAAASLPEGQVMLDGMSVFTIKARVLSFAPADRARVISSRLIRLAKGPLLQIDSIKEVDSESTTDIVAGDTVIMTVTDSDAKADGRPRKLLADDLVQKIRTALANFSITDNTACMNSCWRALRLCCVSCPYPVHRSA